MLTRSLFLASIFTFAIPACGGQTDLAADDSSLADDDSKFDKTSSSGSTGYFQMRPDLRRCAAPACGGTFVKRANFTTISCHDGSTSSECYVAGVDFSKLNLTESEQSSLAGKPLIVKGTISKKTINGKSYGNLVITEAWVGAVGAAPDHDLRPDQGHRLPRQGQRRPLLHVPLRVGQRDQAQQHDVA